MVFEVQGQAPLDAFIGLRIPLGEKVQIEEEARLVGVSVSALVRRRYFGRPVVADADLNLIRELRRVWGLLMQVHESNGAASSSDMAAALSEVRRAIEHLSGARK